MKIQISEAEKERFMSYVYPDPNTGCWLWGGGKLKTGYGCFNGKLENARKAWRAHRFSWLVHGKDLVDGMDLCHTCDNRLCVNPDHLWIGTRKENLQDCRNKGRNPTWGKTHCKHGHEFTEDNIMIRYDGFRECLTCSRETKKRWYDKRRNDPKFKEHNAIKSKLRRSNKPS